MMLFANRLRKSTTMTAPQPQAFGGPSGTLILMLGLPLMVTYLNVNRTAKDSFSIFAFDEFPTKIDDFFDFEATMIYLGWLIFQAFLYALPIGRRVHGLPLKNGEQLSYRMNGIHAVIITLVTFAYLLYTGFPVEIVCSKMLPMTITACIVSCLMAGFLYVRSFLVDKSGLNELGNTGHIIYDVFMGRELNPRIGNFDIKMFLELRPGAFGWVMLNLCFLWKDYKDYGSFYPPLLLSAFWQSLLVLDTLYLEETVLTAMDITTEGLGFMLSFGDLVFVPFVFTVESRYLMMRNSAFSWLSLLFLTGLSSAGFYIYRKANAQKHAFRSNPNGEEMKDFEVIPTGKPKQLLAGGWWGFVRHPNYLGDLIMGWSWCLYCGFDHLLPYIYAIYLTMLLFSRATRDDSFCSRKYKSAWRVYCNKVKYRIIPFVF